MKIRTRGIVPVRLPPSVISLIESYLYPPNFHPVNSTTRSSTIVNDPLSNHDIGHSRRQQIDRASVSVNGNRPSTDPIPIDVPWYFRYHDNSQDSTRSGTSINNDVVENSRTSNAQSKHLLAAHRYLDSISTSSASSIQRQITYSKFISTFLSHPSQLSSIPSLLSRSLIEGIPISSITLTQILKSTLSTPIVEDRREIISEVLKILPGHLDLKLLDVLLRAVIKDFNPDINVVKGMINDSLNIEKERKQSQAIDTATASATTVKRKENWPLDMWDVLLYSHSQKGDFRAALHTLAEMRSTIESHNPVEAAETKDRNDKDTATMAGRKEAICKAYTTTLNLWHDQISRNTSRIPGGRLHSKIPRQLARDLVKLLEGSRPTTGFLNSWFRAERLAENWDMAQKVWNLISSPDIPIDAGVDVSAEGIEREVLGSGRDSHSWTLYFGLYHYCHSSSMSLSDLQPLRESISTFFAQAQAQAQHKHKSTSITLTTPLINSIISAIAVVKKDYELDLPLLLVLLRQAKATVVDNKTIDILSSIIYRAARGFPPGIRKELGLYLQSTKVSTRSPGSVKKKWMRLGLDLKEWDVLSTAISRTKSELNLRENDGKTFKDIGIEEIHLPLSAPIARLDRLDKVDKDIGGDDRTSITTTTTTVPESKQMDNQKISLAQSLLPTMIYLVEKTIIASARVRTNKPTVEDEQLLSNVMRRVNAEVLPPFSSRREKRLAKRALSVSREE